MIKSSYEKDFKKISNTWLWRDVSHRATTDDTKQVHTNSCLSSILIFVSSRAKTNLIETILSINFDTNSIVYELSHKLLSINASIFVSWRAKWLKQLSNKLLSLILSTLISILVSSRASWVETTLTQTLVYQLSYKRLSLNSHTNSCLSILIQTLVYQFSYTLLCINSHENSCLYQLWHKLLSVNSHLCFITSKVNRNNPHTNSCLFTLIQVRTLLY